MLPDGRARLLIDDMDGPPPAKYQKIRQPVDYQSERSKDKVPIAGARLPANEARALKVEP